MWVRKEDHAGTLSGPLLIRGSAGQMYFTFPRAAGIRRFVRPCSRNNDWQDDLGGPEGGGWLTGAECNVREIEQARPVINLCHFQKQLALSSSCAGSGPRSGRGMGASHTGRETKQSNNSTCKGGGRTSERARVCLLVGTTLRARKFDCTERV